MKRARIGDLLRLERIFINPDPAVEYKAIGIRSFGKGIFHYEPRFGNELGSLRFFRVRSDRLILSNIKGWEGAIAVSSDADAKCVASNRFLSYAPVDDSEIDVRWMLWYFLSEPGIELIRRASPGSADRNRTLAIDRFEALEVAVPPIDEQRRVSARLNHLQQATSKVALRTADASALITALTASVALRPDLDEGAKAEAGWQPMPLGRMLIPSSREVSVQADGRYGIGGVYSFGRGMFQRGVLDGTQTSYKTLYELQAGQIVMSRLKAWEGALALVPEELDGWFVSQEFPSFDVDSTLADARYLGAVVSSQLFWSRLKGASKGIGARRERVNSLRLLQQVIDIPPRGEQEAIAHMVTQLGGVRGRHERTREHLLSILPAAVAESFRAAS